MLPIAYLGRTNPKLGDLSFVKLSGEVFRLLPEILDNYRDVENTLGLEQSRRKKIKKMDYEDRIVEVFRIWDENAPNLASGRYPHTWRGLYDILTDSELEQKANDFFDFLNSH